MTVYLVGAGPGDPGLLTRRGARLLSEAEVVIYDRLVHHSVLALARPSAVLIDVGKRPDAAQSGADRQEEINRLLLEHGRGGQVVVRLKGGDPFVFGRGGEEGEVLTRAGVPWQVVPGVSSAFGVPAAVGIPVTQRGFSSSVTVVTGRVGDPSAPGGVDWATLAKLEGTLVILMGMMTRTEIADALQHAGKPASTAVAVIERGTTSSQRVVRTTLDQLEAVDLGSPSVIVVGAVAALGAGQLPLVSAGPLSGRTIVVTRSGTRARGLISALHEAGAETVELPLTRQTEAADGGAALRAAAADVVAYTWVVLTSANAVDRFMGELRDARSLGATLVAAVGPATADALRLAGVEPDLVPAEHSAHGLVEEFPEAASSAGRVLFPGADQAPSTIPDGLEGRGWQVSRVEAYRTVALPPPEEALSGRVTQADAVVFTATSSVRAYLALRGSDGAPLAVPPLVVCIGPTTAGHARELGLANVHEAHGSSTAGLVAALIHHLGGSHPPAS
ncbi:MAG TPA: uroporphyrinogen-III C-methyltransferase [Acidimicrobiales bacterium]|jgi:uroporphyrinogen III methyltransferase/synthase